MRNVYGDIIAPLRARLCEIMKSLRSNYGINEVELEVGTENKEKRVAITQGRMAIE